MTRLSQRRSVGLFVVGLTLLPAAAASGQERPPIVEKLAKTYGLDSFGRIEAIRYTFSAQIPGIRLFRSWTWEPKTDRVTYEAKDKSGKPVRVTYLRAELAGQPANVKEMIDPGFVNDQYWLLLPFHVSWDGAAVQDAGVQKLPLGRGSAEKVVVKYSPGRGYSQGDTWELYVGRDGRIRELTFRRGGTAKPAVVNATWADYRKAGPLLFSLDHRGTADGQPLRVSFSKVAVKLTGSNNWIEAR